MIQPNLTFRYDYAHEDEWRERLYPLFQEVFSIPEESLRDLHRSGFWNPSYVPFTWFLKKRAVANVSMFTLDLMVDHQNRQAAGIQSVMTHPDFRGQGLMRSLFERMLEEVDRRFALSFLYTKTPALYEPFGYRVLPETDWLLSIQNPDGRRRTPSLKKLDLKQSTDIRLIRNLFQEHAPLSHRFSPIHHASSFYLQVKGSKLNDRIYYSQRLGVFIVFEYVEGTLHLHDVVGSRLPSLEALCMEIGEPISQIRFYFPPDGFTSEEVRPIPREREMKLMVRGDFRLEDISFPLTAQF